MSFIYFKQLEIENVCQCHGKEKRDLPHSIENG